MATNNIQVVLEIGHTALCRPTTHEGQLTHDWVVFLRGPKENPAGIQTIIRKVVFTLHPSFQNPIRVVDKPPYEIRESGYAGFILPVDIYFKGRSDDMPYRIRFDYDLTIPGHESVNCMQTEKITFRNPSFEFRRKLLEGGGCGVLETDQQAVMPGKRLMQTFKHPHGGNGMHAGKLEGVPSFEEFAKLFKMTVSAPPGKGTVKATEVGKRTRKASSGSSASSTAGDKTKRPPVVGEEDKKKRQESLGNNAATTRSPVPPVAAAEKKIENGVKKIGVVEPTGKVPKNGKIENIRPTGSTAAKTDAQRPISSVPNQVSEQTTSGKNNNRKGNKTTLSPSGITTDTPASTSGASKSKSVLSQPETNAFSQSHTAQVPLSTNNCSRHDNVSISTELSAVSPLAHAAPTAPAATAEAPLNASLLSVMTPPTSKLTPKGSSQPLTPHTPYLSDEIRQQTSVPRMLSPLSPPEDYPNDGSSADEDLALTPGPRRDSTGFSPAPRPPNDGSSITNPDNYLIDLTNDGFISGISDPSDTSPEPSPHRQPVKSRQKASAKKSQTQPILHPVEPDLRDVRINDKPISPVDAHDEVSQDVLPLNDVRSKSLSPDEEYERYKLQVVLSQLSDRTIIQSVVDVLVPLGAFSIDDKEGVFTFDTYGLDKSTVEIIKTLARFEDYTFATED